MAATSLRLPVRTLLLVLALLGAGRLAAAVQLVPLQPPRLWQCAEFRLEGVPATPNNFDPDLIRVDVTVTAPSGASRVVPAFWYQGFNRARTPTGEVLTEAGTPEWRLRFTPTEPGGYVLSVAVALRDAAALPPVVARLAVPAGAPAAPRGWAELAPDRREFATSDGRPLRLVGANVCWAERGGTYDYDRWFGAMHGAGENFARLWMSPWWAGIEHRPGTLNQYDQKSAWEFDHIFQLAARDGIYLLFCLDHHGMFQTNNRNWGGSNNFWNQNPYAAANGGPCAEPNDFFTDPRAKDFYRKRLRYLVARYGYSPYLLAWEFFNEIDNVFGPGQLREPDVIAWHRETGDWMRAHDPYHHLLTTSLTGGSDRPDVWTVPELDFAGYHSYNEADVVAGLPALARSFLQRYGKPVMIGEFGIDSRSWDLAADPYLRGFRQGLWAGALGGSVGSAMPWWWQDLDADDVYPLFAAMTGFLRRGGWYDGAWMPVEFAGADPPPPEVGAVAADGEEFTALLAPNGSWRAELPNVCAIASPLAAQRASEYLSAFVQGSSHAERQRPIRLSAWFGDKAKLVAHVNSVSAGAELVVRVDGKEALHEAIADRDGQPAVNNEINRDFTVDLPAGRHRVEIANSGRDWLYLESVRLEAVRPAAFAGGWAFQPEAVGLRQGGRALLYVCSPAVVFPAGAHRYNPPLEAGATVTLREWPAGRFRAQWTDPRTGEPIGVTEGTAAADGALTLPLPDFRDDLAGLVAPASADSARP